MNSSSRKTTRIVQIDVTCNRPTLFVRSALEGLLTLFLAHAIINIERIEGVPVYVASRRIAFSTI